MFELISWKEWDDRKFQEFVNFRNGIHRSIESSLPESINDYKKYFHLSSPFQGSIHWHAFQVQVEGKIIGQAILTWKSTSDIGNLGFLDWVENLEAASFLVSIVEKEAVNLGLKSLKTPVDINFFVKYRIRLPGGKPPFYGEPIYPDYYHQLFLRTGFKSIAVWDTYKLNKRQEIKNFIIKRKVVREKNPAFHHEIKIRPIRVKAWEQELRIVHELFHLSFKDMPEFEPINFDQFKLIYDDFKYIINPWLAYIVELNGNPVGFSINYADPLKILKSIQGKNLNLIQKAFLLLRLKFNRSRLLIAYLGKVPGPHGEEIKGIGIKMTKNLTWPSFFMKEILVCYQSEDSPSKRSFDNRPLEHYAKYCLYGKSLK